jgi:hypothetical protein
MDWLKRALWFLTRVDKEPGVYLLRTSPPTVHANPVHRGLPELQNCKYEITWDPYCPAYVVNRRRWLWEL